MRKFLKWMTLSCIGSMTLACNESEPWINYHDNVSGENSVIYQAPEGIRQSIQAGYHPNALLKISEDTLIYADSGTRQIVQLNIKSKQLTPLFDFAELDATTSVSHAYGNIWGYSLLRLTDDWCMLANPASSLIIFNLKTGEYKALGEIQHSGAVLPQNGTRVGDIDFALFSGIGRSETGFYFVFGDQIFHAEWHDADPATLLNAPLKHVAGSMDDDENADPANAYDIHLKLHSYTSLVELNGWLFFWEYRALRAVKDGKIFTVTGDGYVAPNCALEDFYAQGLPMDPVFFAYRDQLVLPYWDSRSALAFVQIDQIDENALTARGNVKLVYPEAGSIDGVDLSGDTLFTTNADAGSFYQIDLSDALVATRILGPENEEIRDESILNDTPSPYYPAALIAPNAIVPMLNGKASFVYSPSLKLLHIVTDNIVQPFWKISLSTIVSDSQNQAWIAEGLKLNFIQLSDNGELTSTYVPRFFELADIQGLPCTHSVLKLLNTSYIAATENGLLIRSSEQKRTVFWNENEDKAQQLHGYGWTNPSQMDGNEGTLSLVSEYIQLWQAKNLYEISVLKEEDRQYLVVSSLADDRTTIAGHKLPRMRSYRLAGGGSNPIANGETLENTKLDHITAIALDDESNIVVASGNKLYSTTSQGKWLDLSDRCSVPEGALIEDLSVSGTQENQIYVARINGNFKVCSRYSHTFEGQDVKNTWIDIEGQDLVSCGANEFAIKRAQKICTTGLDKAGTKCISMPDDFSFTNMACNQNHLYLAGTSGDRSLIYASELSNYGEFEIFAGNGNGFPDQIEISKATIGTSLGKMAIDKVPFLHFWMKDTCSIWKIAASSKKEIESDSMLYQVAIDPRICRAKTFAVSNDGVSAIIQENTLYTIEKTELFAKTEIPGDPIDMAAYNDGYVIMTTEGLYLYRDEKLEHKVPAEITIDDQTIHYAVPGAVFPRLMQVPGENAVIIPVFEGDRLIKIAL